MKRSFLICSLCFFALFSTQALSDAVDEAQVFVLRHDSQSDDLLRLSKGHIESTEAYKTIINSIGEEKADRLIFKSFLDVQCPYRIEWERSLAESYLEVFSIYELNSIAKEAKKSPYYSKFIESRKAIGESALLRSENTIKAVAAKAIEKAIASFKEANE